jgi:outer membrane protein, multidrug efflux system
MNNNRSLLFRLSLFGSLTAFVSGCAEFRGMPPMEVALPKTFAEARTAKHVPSDALQHNAWMANDDITLQKILKRIVRDNLSLEQASFRLRAARDQTVLSGYLPNVTGSLSTQYDRTLSGESSFNRFGGNLSPTVASDDGTTGYYQAKLDATWQLPLYGQVSAARQGKDASIAFAEADMAAVRTSILTEAVRLYAEMRKWQSEVRLRHRMVKSQTDILRYQQIKHTAGLITNREKARAEEALSSAKQAVASAKAAEVIASQQLSALLGKVTPDTAWKENKPIPRFAPPPLTTPLDVLRTRPDIAKAESSVMTAAAELTIDKAALYPNISLNGTLAQLDNVTGTPLLGKTVQLSGIPTISLPLLDWGQRLSKAKVQDAKLSEAGAAYREVVVRAMTEVEEKWAAYKAARVSTKENLYRVKLARTAAKDANLLFSRGIADGIEVENARSDVLQARIALLQARSDEVAQLAALQKALGVEVND